MHVYVKIFICILYLYTVTVQNDTPIFLLLKTSVLNLKHNYKYFRKYCLLKRKKNPFTYIESTNIYSEFKSYTIYHDIIYLIIPGRTARLNYLLQNRRTNWKLNWIYFLLTNKYCHFLGIFYFKLTESFQGINKISTQ